MRTKSASFDAGSAQRARADFPSLSRRVSDQPTADSAYLAYLDGPAGTQVPRQVIDAIGAYYTEHNANTDGRFVTSRESDEMLGRARETVARLLGAPSGKEISFGANMTTLTYALSHALARTLEPGDEIVITQLDHEANRGPWLALRERGVIVNEIELSEGITLDAEDMARKITARTRLVALGYSSNAFGTVNDLRLARELSKRVGAKLFIDAVHGAPHFPLDVMEMDADFLVCSAYKFYGPHVGILYCRAGLLDSLETDRLRTQYPQAPYRIETGTLNHAAIAGVQAAIDYIAGWGSGSTERERIVSAISGIGAYEHGLAGACYRKLSSVPRTKIWGPSFEQARAPTIAITMEGETPTSLATQLGRVGIAVWDGDFYAARPMELLGLDQGGGVLRVGISMYNTHEEIDRLIEALNRIARR